MVQLYDALVADRLAFNSAFNRSTFLSGDEDLLKAMPDAVPHGGRRVTPGWSYGIIVGSMTDCRRCLPMR